MARIDVFPPHGFIELKKWSGDELDIANAARVSFANESEYEQEFSLKGEGFDYPRLSLSKKDKGLINFLLRERHGTPFEQGMMAHWHIKCPLYVARQWFKHRIGCSYNEMSGRYTEYEPEFYIPDKTVIREQGGKPGAYAFEPLKDEAAKASAVAIIKANGERCWKTYQGLLACGVAKEQARTVLPLNMYTEFRWTTNARSLMHFLSLRNESQAQYEIKKYAEAVEEEFRKALPTVHKAFVENGRITP